MFLRLLLSQQALDRFLRAADGAALHKNLADLRSREKAAEGRGDERILRSIRDSIATAELRVDNFEKARSNAEFIGVDVRRYELAAFVIAGVFAGLAGGLFGIFNRGVFPDFAYWTKSSEVLIMTLLGGMSTFFGPSIGALVLILLNQQIVSYTEYWPLVLGTVLVVLLFGFPGGIAGAIGVLSGRLFRRVRSA